MDEAEYLCDRVAVIDAGRVVATDSPAGLVAGITVEQTLTFRVSRPLDEDILSGLLEVTGVRTDGDRVEVRGVGNLLVSVVTTLARHGIAPTELHSTQPSLDDAFVALTGDKITTTPATTAEGALR
jgi:ABC-2 type transport system ATP-binding protein